jgi:hypothetical protein
MNALERSGGQVNITSQISFLLRRNLQRVKSRTVMKANNLKRAGDVDSHPTYRFAMLFL